MFKLYILLALAVAGVSAQLSQPAGSEAAPEPYSYGYETDSHSAAEQRDPSGKVTGFYTLVDADGRQRRVEYIADEAGFRAKVQTNELGTKSENSADVEISASPATEAQLAPVPVQAAAPAIQSQSLQRTVQVSSAPARSSAISYSQQPNGYSGYYGYQGAQTYPGYGYSSTGSQYGYTSQPYGYGYTATSYSPSNYGYGYTNAPAVGYGYSSAPSVGYGYTTGSVGNYNNHLPSQYYRSIQSSTGVTGAPVVSGVRYVSSSGVVPQGSYQNQGSYRSYSSSSSSSVPSSVASSGQLLGGSNNYIVLKKRAAEEKN